MEKTMETTILQDSFFQSLATRAESRRVFPCMSYSLNSLQEHYIGDYIWDYYWGY